MIVLGIESSCDETAASIVKDGKTLLSNAVFSSMDLHKAYGGVVPEIAARSHIESILPVIEQALIEAEPSLRLEMEDRRLEKEQDAANPQSVDLWSAIDAIAVTYGAGLGGSLLVGTMTARTLAIAKDKPLYAINHVEAHVYANFITEVSGPTLDPTAWKMRSEQPEFPVLALIVSGGHSQLALFRGHFDYTLLGQTRDDAIGEAYDKVAKIIGLPYPGGPSVSKAAESGDPDKYKFPKARLEGMSPALARLRLEMKDRRLERLQGSGVQPSDPKSSTLYPQPPSHGYDFSFSGPKTAVLRLAQKEIGEDYTFPSFKLAERLSDTQKNDIAASFQRIAIETVVDKAVLAYQEFQPKSVVIAGGVAANSELRKQMSDRIPINIEYPDMKLCTDNGAMIAALGCFKAMNNQPTADPYSLSIEPSLSM